MDVDCGKTHLRVVEKENHRLVVHTGLHETQLEVLVPLHRSVVLGDLNLIQYDTYVNQLVKIWF